MTKLVRFKTFYHLPGNETMNSSIKGASYSGYYGNKKLKLRPEGLKFFSGIIEDNNHICNNIKRERLYNDKETEAIRALSYMNSGIKGASAYPSTCNKIDKQTALALKNLRRIIASNYR